MQNSLKTSLIIARPIGRAAQVLTRGSGRRPRAGAALWRRSSGGLVLGGTVVRFARERRGLVAFSLPREVFRETRQQRDQVRVRFREDLAAVDERGAEERLGLIRAARLGVEFRQPLLESHD